MLPEITPNNIKLELEEVSSLLSPVGLSSKSNKGKYDTYETTIFYLFDLHLECHINIKNNPKTEIKNLIKWIISNSPELDAILKWRRFKNESRNYDDLIRKLTRLRDNIKFLQEKESLSAPDKKVLKADIKSETELSEIVQTQSEQIEKIKNDIFKDMPSHLIEYGKTHPVPYIILGGDIADSFEFSKLFYHELRATLPNDRIVAIIGNHELSTFASKDLAIQAYSELFSSESIAFLNNNGVLQMHLDEIYFSKHPDYIVPWQDKLLAYSFNTYFYGGIGFNKYDDVHTADNIITSPDIQGNRTKEHEECERFIEGYRKALEYAESHNKVLVVLSHYPIYSWLKKDEYSSRCYYFYGHDHENQSYSHNGAYVFGDNQIGYTDNIISFKVATLSELVNPFYNFGDSFYKISLQDYKNFYRFAGEGFIGSGKIEKYLAKGFDFYMIKKSGFYAFFLTKDNKNYLCQGGNVISLSEMRLGILHYYKKFDEMVACLTHNLYKYRQFQEQISKEVQSIGGDGTMHGLIVDYDHWHHIFINPYDSTLTFYYSPTMGMAMNLTNIEGLVKHASKSEIEAKNNLLMVKDDYLLVKQNKAYALPAEDSIPSLKSINISESLYVESRKIKNLERIFTAGILREWNEDIMKNYDSLFSENTTPPK